MKLAVIPARGGSKRIPMKNIRHFCGRPIIAYSLDVAIESGLFDRVVVSTDSLEIASVAKSLGAEVPFIRSAELSGDFIGTNRVVRDAIEWFDRNGETVSLVCCIYPTAPFLLPEYVQQGLQLLSRTRKSFAFSVTTYEFAIQRSLRINEIGCIEAVWPKNSLIRSQDLEECYHDAGQFYWGTAEAYRNDVALYSTASVPVIIPRYLVQDIDTEEDWRRAELMYAAFLKGEE